MKLLQIQYFLGVHKAGSFSKAAERLALTQPALSRQIGLLERELGRPLFERRRQGLLLTPAGERFLHYAKRFDGLYREMEAALHGPQSSGLEGEFHISTGGTIAAYTLPVAIRGLHREFPNLRLRIREGDALETRESLLNGEVDLAILSEKIRERHLVSVPFFVERIVPVLSRSHPLSQKRRLAVKDLKDEPFILFHSSSAIQRAIAPLLRGSRLGFVPNVLMELQSLESAIRCIEAGLGIGFLSESSLNQKLKALPLPGLSASRSYDFVHRRQHKAGLPLLVQKILKYSIPPKNSHPP